MARGAAHVRVHMRTRFQPSKFSCAAYSTPQAMPGQRAHALRTMRAVARPARARTPPPRTAPAATDIDARIEQWAQRTLPPPKATGAQGAGEGGEGRGAGGAGGGAAGGGGLGGPGGVRKRSQRRAPLLSAMRLSPTYFPEELLGGAGAVRRCAEACSY